MQIVHNTGFLGVRAVLTTMLALGVGCTDRDLPASDPDGGEAARQQAPRAPEGLAGTSATRTSGSEHATPDYLHGAQRSTLRRRAIDRLTAPGLSRRMERHGGDGRAAEPGPASPIEPAIEPAEVVEELLDAVEPTAMGYRVDDMLFASEESLLDYFAGMHAGHGGKGLVDANKTWSDTVVACWTSDSDATQAQRQDLVDFVTATWAGYGDVSFDFTTSSGAFRQCSGSSDSSDVKIYHDSSITRGCAYVGTDHLSAMGADCDTTSGTNEHAFATAVLRTQSNGNPPEFGYLHEFGHVVGIYHEQQRTDSTCTSPSDSNNEPDGSTQVGDYDDNSVMNYCAAAIGSVSGGDVASAQFLYGPASTRVTFRASSWYAGQVEARVQDPPWNVGNVFSFSDDALPAQTQINGLTLDAAQSYSATATATDSRLTCFVNRPAAPLVRGGPVHALPNDFADAPVVVSCLDVSALIAVL